MSKTLPLLVFSTFILAGCGPTVPSASQFSWNNLPQVTNIERDNNQITVYQVDEIVSQENDMHTFVTKVAAPLMRQKTKTLKVEVCGSVCQAPNGSLGITITTVGSKASCPVTDACPKGMTVKQEHIHTHVDVSSYTPSDIDKLFLKGDYKKEQQVFTQANRFSDIDLLVPYGFLVTEDQVLYQEGQANVWVLE